MGTLLHAEIIPPVGGDTCWASTTAAYDALSPR
jgi:taurine dioxygenase